MDTVERLLEVIAVRGTIAITYDGGTAPGTTRGVAPIEVRDGELVARCLVSNERKTFKLSKLRIAGSEPVRSYVQAAQDKVQLESRTFQDWVDASLPQLRAAGWHIEHGEDHISLHRLFKNGKPRKTASVALHHCPTSTSWEWDDALENMAQVTRVSTRPWHTCERSFGSLAHAFQLFLSRAEVAPE